MEIRIANRNDAYEIQRIYAPYVSDTNITFEYDVPSIEEMAQRIEKTLKKYPYLVAIIDDHIVGYAYASGYRGRKAYDWDSELSIYIDQNCQGQGIGRKLYQVLFDMLSEMNVKNVYACITHPNIKSERFHESLGFQKAGILTKSGYKFKKWHDVIWMEKAIGDYQKVADIIPFPLIESTKILCSSDK